MLTIKRAPRRKVRCAQAHCSTTKSRLTGELVMVAVNEEGRPTAIEGVA